MRQFPPLALGRSAAMDMARICGLHVTTADIPGGAPRAIEWGMGRL